MRIKNLFKKISKTPKRYIAAIAAGLIIAVPIAVKAGYGPNRPVFDWNNPADRGGSLTGPVFNSFINTPTYGDERAFVDAKDSANTNLGGFADTVDAVADKEYTVRAYVHNNANQEFNDAAHNFSSVATNTKLKFTILPGAANGNEVTGAITADNATPNEVYDTVKFKNDNAAFSLEYVPGSARLESNAHPYPGVSLPDSITTTGALIGDSQDGNFPGCFEFTEIVTIKVRVKMPKLELQKRVSKVEAPKSTDSSENITANRGDTITWRIDYKNVGTDVAKDITIRDQIPAGLTLVPGSITWIDVNHQSGKQLPDTALTAGGVDVGNYAPNGNGVIRFRTKINDDIKECLLTNVAFARASDIPEMSDNASVTIANCNQQTPVYSCDLLTLTKIGDNKYRYTVNATANGGATITQYMYTFGDGTTLNSTNTTVEHTYAKAGNYVATVKVQVRVNGQDKIAEAAACSKPITFTTTPPTTPPTTLVNTGPGDVAGIFAAVTVAGAFVHKYLLNRKFQ